MENDDAGYKAGDKREHSNAAEQEQQYIRYRFKHRRLAEQVLLICTFGRGASYREVNNRV
jgi:hypothetical protein